MTIKKNNFNSYNQLHSEISIPCRTIILRFRTADMRLLQTETDNLIECADEDPIISIEVLPILMHLICV